MTSDAQTVRILIADDHELMRKGIGVVLADRPEWSIVGEASTGIDAVELARRTRPDVAIVDLSMPLRNGLEVTRLLRAELPATRVIVLTAHDSPSFVAQALNAGAAGYLLKSELGAELLRAVEAVLADRPYFASQVARLVLEGFLRNQGSEPIELLSPRERELLQMIAEGKSTKEIAQQLDISTKTAETHRTNLMRKTGCRSVAELVRFAVRIGVIQP